MPNRGRLFSRIRLLALAAAALAALISGCDDDDDFDDDGVFDFAEEISFAEARSVIEREPTRVQIELFADGETRVARELELQRDSARRTDEQIEANVVPPGFLDLTVDGACQGALALDLDPIVIEFDQTVTMFEDEDGDLISCEQFVAEVQAILEAGGSPRLEADRRPTQMPQAPDDPVFFADEIALVEDTILLVPELDVLIDGNNLVECGVLASPPADCLGVIQVFGFPIAITDETDIEAEEDVDVIDVDFQGLVQEVNPGVGELVLTNGVILRFVEGTDIDVDVDGTALESLEQVQQALAEGRQVLASGDGAVLSTDPLVILVDEIELEVVNGMAPDDFPEEVFVEGPLLAVAEDQPILTLPFETDVLVTEQTILQGDFADFEEARTAFLAGESIFVEATGPVVETEPRTLVRADQLRLFVE